MSSSWDSSYYVSQAVKAKNKPCKKGKEHKWEKHGGWPSIWEVCKNCGETIYWK